MKANRRVTGATPTRRGNVDFKSRLEARVYAMYTEAGLHCEYEPVKETLVTGFKPTVPYFRGKAASGKTLATLKSDMTKVRGMTYCPDLVVTLCGKRFAVECKGYQTDSYLLKRKLFRRWLEDTGQYAAFFEVGNLSQARQAMELMKEMTGKEEEDEGTQ